MVDIFTAIRLIERHVPGAVHSDKPNGTFGLRHLDAADGTWTWDWWEVPGQAQPNAEDLSRWAASDTRPPDPAPAD